jgi:hypothetical protein
MKLIVGLGNPGNEYENTRHNTGRIMVALVAKKLEDKIKNYYNKKNNFSNNDLIKLTVQLEKGVEQNLIGVEIYDENHKIIGNVETYNKETGVALINVTSKIKMKLVDIEDCIQYLEQVRKTK